MTPVAIDLRRPLIVQPNLVERFYDGGGLVRAFRGLAGGDDSRWSEDWIGSWVSPGHMGGGRRASTRLVIDDTGRSVELGTLFRDHRREMLGEFHDSVEGVSASNPGPAFLVKLVSAATRIPLHVHPTREFAKEKLRSRFGKTEAWIVLDARGASDEPPYAGIGFRKHVTRAWLTDAIAQQDHSEFADALNRCEVASGDVFLIRGGVPHFFGPQILVLNVQEPTDLGVLAEWQGAVETEADATMGLGWDAALDMFDFSTADEHVRARQRPSAIWQDSGNAESRLFEDSASHYFDATRLEIATRAAPADGQFYIGAVTAGAGWVEGEFGRQPLKKGDVFAVPASLSHVFECAEGPLQILRCLGPSRGPLPDSRDMAAH